MTTPHKHAESINAIAAGAGVEYACNRFDGWRRVTHFGTFDIPDCRFRLIPHRWQREIDAQKAGSMLQCRTRDDGRWFDSVVSAHDFTEPNSEFRIKPPMVWFRVAAMRNKNGLMRTQTVDGAGSERDLFSDSKFVCWLGDWQEVEVPA